MAVYVGSGPMASLISAESVAALKRDADAVSGQIRGLTAQIEEQERALAGLRDQRVLLQQGLDKIESLVRAASGHTGALPVVGTPSSVETSEVVPNNAPTLASQIEGVIRDANAPLHYKEILIRLQSAGVEVGGKDPAATLLSILANKRYEGRFTRFERGVYALAEMSLPSPARKRPSKRRRRRIKTDRKATQ